MALTGKRVLVTGASGFIGSHLAEALVREGARVLALVHYRHDGTWGWLDESPLRSEIEVRAGDVCDPGCMQEATKGCEVVFHLAALIGIPYSYTAPSSYVRVNVEGTLQMLLAARSSGVLRIVQTSTSEVYGTPDSVPIRETHPLRPQSPYAASKVAADALALSFYYSYQLPVTVLRPFNTYGPRQSNRAVLPTILTQLLKGAQQIRLGTLSSRRDLTYVSDTVKGFLKAAESDNVVGRTIQLGTGEDCSIMELAEVAMRVVGVKAEIISDSERFRPSCSEVQRLLSCPDLAKETMGWEPAVKLSEGMQQTVEWFRSNTGKYEVHGYVV